MTCLECIMSVATTSTYNLGRTFTALWWRPCFSETSGSGFSISGRIIASYVVVDLCFRRIKSDV